MRLFISNILLILFTFSGTAIKADAWDEYLDLIIKYQTIKSIKGSVTTKYYLESINKVSKTENGEFKIAENRKWLNYDNVISISNDKYQITVDKTNKYVMLSNGNSKEAIDKVIAGMKPISKDSLAKLKNVAQMNKSITATGDKVFEMIFPEDNAYKKISLQFTNDGVFSKMTYEFNREKDKGYPYKVEIIYKDLILNGEIDSEEFSEKKILTIKGDNVKLLDKYNTYKLLDYRKLQTNSKK